MHAQVDDAVWEEKMSLLHTLSVPDPPPWLRGRVMVAIRREEQRQRQRRVYLRRCFGLALLLQCVLFVASDRTGQ